MDTATVVGIVGIVISILALVLGVAALPTVFQMFCGRPKLTIGTDEHTSPDGKELYVTIKNSVIGGRLLRQMGVRRDVGDVTATFDIRELGTNKYVAKDARGLLHNAAARESNFLVRALPGRTIGLPVIQFNEVAAVVDGRAEKLPQIAAGHYTVDAVVICGEDIYQFSKELAVGAERHQTYWT